MNDSEQDHQTEEFLTLIDQYSRSIYAVILRMVLNRNDADDIYQETCIVLWRKFSDFQQGTNFRLWSSRIAINQVMAWRTQLKREKVVFSSKFLETVAEETASIMEDRSEDISDCFSKLSQRHQEMITLRYKEQWEVDIIAEKYHRTANAIYRLLQRIREKLFLCFESKRKFESYE